MQSILVVDDSASDRFFLRRTLEKVSPDSELHEFSYAEDALQFLRSPARPKVDLLLIDINMPRMTGFEFAEAYASLYPELRGNAPLYIVSSSLDPEDQALAKSSSSVAGYLEKPVGRDTLRGLMNDVGD